MENFQKQYPLPYKIKADWKGFSILLFVFEIPFIIMAIAFAGQQIPLWICGIIAAFLPACWWFLLSTFGIIITDDRIICKSLFSKDEEMLLAEIKSVKFAYGLNKSTKRGYGFFQLVIAHKVKSKPIIINMKMLSGKDLAILVDALLTKNPSIETDKNVERIRDKELKEVVSTALKMSMGQIIWWLLSIAIGTALVRLIFLKK